MAEPLAPSPPCPVDLLSHLLTSLHSGLHPESSLREADMPSSTTSRPDQSKRPLDPGPLREHLIDLVTHLPPLLPDSCEWLEQGAFEVVGERPIDAGSVADVWVGMIGNRKVAIKSYRYYSSSDYLPTYVRFYNEALACSRLKGQTVVPFIGICSTPEHPSALVFDFMDHMNLREHLKNDGDVRRLELLLEIARGVEYVHKLNVVHGNLKSTNILIDSEEHARIAGLGAALIPSPMPGVDIDRFFHGAAPELVDPQRTGPSDTGATKASDVYAFAVLAWEIFAGGAPFSDENNVSAVLSMLKGRRPARPDHPELSDRLWKMIKKCWDVNPARRKEITAIVAALEAEVTAHHSRSYTLYRNQA